MPYITWDKTSAGGEGGDDDRIGSRRIAESIEFPPKLNEKRASPTGSGGLGKSGIKNAGRREYWK